MVTLSWKEVLQSPHQEVVVLSYGYEEKGILGSHFEPFKHKREFKFTIDREFEMLVHPWLYLTENEKSLTFQDEGHRIILDDPDLWARP